MTRAKGISGLVYHAIGSCALTAMVLAPATESGNVGRHSEPPGFRVVSFNIRYDNPADGANAWANRRIMVASMIRFHRADLVGLQEALKNQLDDLVKWLPEYSYCGVGRNDGRESGEYSAILYLRDRFTPLECSTFWLSQTPDQPGSKGWDAALPRVVSWARFRHNPTGKQFFHFNTHFDHLGRVAREQSARLLTEKIHQLAGDAPVIVTGDMNFDESSAGYKILISGSAVSRPPASTLRDGRYVAKFGHHGPTSSFNNFKAPGPPGSRIDYVLVSGAVSVLMHGILSELWDGRFPSDHFPVLADIVLD